MHTDKEARSMHLTKRQAATGTCTSLYQHPAAGETIEAYTPYYIQWNPACLVDNSTIVDIYLYDISGLQAGPIFKWSTVPASIGTFETQFQAAWWKANSSDSTQFKMQFANQGEPNWAASYAVGPAFTVNFNGTVPEGFSDTASGEAGVSEQISNPGAEAALAAGKLVAAILIPLLFTIGAIGGYVFWQRKKSRTQTKRWSRAVDRRMSQISQTWQGSTRNSMAASQRAATLTHARNESNYSFTSPNASFGSRPTSMVAGDRQSRISFAPQSSPSKNRDVVARPLSTASYPRLGGNGLNKGDVLQPLSPEQESPELLGHPAPIRGPFQRSHAHSKSLASSLRNEVNMFDEHDLAAAVSYIKASDQDLLNKSTSSNGSLSEGKMGPYLAPSRTGSFYSTNASSQASVGHSAHQHVRQESDLVSLKMPRLNERSSLSPDQALAAYSQTKDKSTLPVTTHVAHGRSQSSANPFVKRLSMAEQQMKLSNSTSDPSLAKSGSSNNISYGMAQ